VLTCLIFPSPSSLQLRNESEKIADVPSHLRFTTISKKKSSQHTHTYIFVYGNYEAIKMPSFSRSSLGSELPTRNQAHRKSTETARPSPSSLHPPPRPTHPPLPRRPAGKRRTPGRHELAPPNQPTAASNSLAAARHELRRESHLDFRCCSRRRFCGEVCVGHGGLSIRARDRMKERKPAASSSALARILASCVSQVPVAPALAR
jgi:hypothetical protein